MSERIVGANGEETDVQGNPWTETFPIRILKRLLWQRHVNEKIVTDLLHPQTPIPKTITVEPGNVTSMQGFRERHQRRMRNGPK